MRIKKVVEGFKVPEPPSDPLFEMVTTPVAESQLLMKKLCTVEE